MKAVPTSYFRNMWSVKSSELFDIC